MTALVAKPAFTTRWRKRLIALIVTAALLGLGLPATDWVCALTKGSDTSVITDMRAVGLFRYLCRCTYSHCLQPDEAILAHYEKHKSTFDEVVRRIRWEWGSDMLELNGVSRTRPEILAMLGPLDVRVDLQGTWPPPPGGFPTNIREYAPGCKACNAEIRFDFVSYDEKYRHPDDRGNPRLKGFPTTRSWTLNWFAMTDLTKEIVAFPYMPTMKNGKLMDPTDIEYGLSSRLVTSLDEAKLPEHPGDCVYRHIEGVVFLRMCEI